MDINQIIIDKLELDELLNVLIQLHQVGKIQLNKGIEGQNLGYIGEAKSSFVQAEALLKLYQKKQSGQKEPVVVS